MEMTLYDPMQVFAINLFGIKENIKFGQYHNSDDPRGYVDIYGDDPDEIHFHEEHQYKTLTVFFSHISVIFPNFFGLTITPYREICEVQIIDLSTYDLLMEGPIRTNGFWEFISDAKRKYFA